MTRWVAMVLWSIAAVPTAAQVPDQPAIVVTGQGEVTTPPDVATLGYEVRGEGATPDDATAALAKRNKAIMAGLIALLGSGAEVTASEVNVIATRGKNCPDGHEGDGSIQLSTGACAVTGYLATLQGRVLTTAVSRAGTAVGLAKRLGATGARVQGFALANEGEARRRAMAVAFAMPDRAPRRSLPAAASGSARC